MKKIVSKEIDNDNSFEKMISKINSVEERNILRVINYCGQSFEYENEYFTINRKTFIPGIYCVDKDIYYVFDFIDKYKQQRELIDQLANKFKDELNFKWISLEQYEKIINWFKDKILTLETEIEVKTEIAKEETVKEKEINIKNDRFKIKEKMISKMVKIKSSDSTFDVESISDEAERNLLKIMNYCKRDFEYQCHSFELDNTVFIPNIFCLKNTTFYILNFIDYYRGANQQKIIEQFKERYPEVKIKQILLKQYRRILHWFQDDILFESKKYKINFNLYKRRRIKCAYCGKKFFSENKKDKFCSEECAKNALDNKEKRKVARPHRYYNGYYMDIHHYVRSSWEHNVARILQINQLDYDYEEYAFKMSDGSVYIPDFYVYADDTYYEVKGEMRTNTLAKYNMFKEEYPDKRLVIIDSKIYKNLLEQFPNINFTKHAAISNVQIKNLSKLRNITQYRHNEVKYESWELDYQLYTNQRIVNTTNKQLFISSINKAQKIFNISKKQILSWIQMDRITYMYYKEQYWFNINLMSRQINANYTKHKNMIKTNVQLNKKGLFIESNTDLFTLSINSQADKNIITILQYLKLDCFYEHKMIELVNDDDDDSNKKEIIVSKIFVPLDGFYYFCKFDYNPNLQYKIVHYLPDTLQYKIISKREYNTLMQRFNFLFNEVKTEEKVFTKEVYCERCGKQIDPKKISPSYTPRFCSRQCRTKSLAKENQTINKCFNCGKDIVVKNIREKMYQQFCSDSCALEYKDKLEKKLIPVPVSAGRKLKLSFHEQTCKNCHKTFYYVSNHEHKYCSEKCRLEYVSENVVYHKTCPQCEKDFDTDNAKQKYCSVDCAQKALKNKDTEIYRAHLYRVNDQVKSNLLHKTFVKVEDANIIKNKTERSIAVLLIDTFNKVDYKSKCLQLKNGTLICAQFYVPSVNYYYFLKNSGHHHQEKINQYMKENPDSHRIILIDLKIAGYALKLNKLVTKPELAKFITLDYFQNLVESRLTLVLQQLRRYNVPIYVDYLFRDTLILVDDVYNMPCYYYDKVKDKLKI